MKVLGNVLIILFTVATLFFGTSLVMANIHDKSMVDEWKTWFNISHVESLEDSQHTSKDLLDDISPDIGFVSSDKTLEDDENTDTETEETKESDTEYEVLPL